MSLTLRQRKSIPEARIYQILGNPRRRHALSVLSDLSRTISVRELAEEIAAAEAGGAPAPSDLRNSVYASLRQTHLPYLESHGVVSFNPETNRVKPLPRVREIDRYQDLVTYYGLTWAEIYRYLGLCSLLAVLGSLTAVPVFGAVDALVWVTLSLTSFAIVSTVQLWRDRGHYLRWVRR
ncbi:MAG: hypothetical protein ABEJ74_01895 [Haloferacaceae archaeon]